MTERILDGLTDEMIEVASAALKVHRAALMTEPEQLFCKCGEQMDKGELNPVFASDRAEIVRRHRARAALEAVLPLIKKELYGDAAALLDEPEKAPLDRGPIRAALRARREAEEKKFHKGPGLLMVAEQVAKHGGVTR